MFLIQFSYIAYDYQPFMHSAKIHYNVLSNFNREEASLLKSIQNGMVTA